MLVTHGEMVGSPMVPLLHYYDTVPSFGQVFGRDTTATAAAHDDHVGLDDLGLGTRRELDEFIVEAFPRNHADGHSGNAQDPGQSVGGLDPRLIDQHDQRTTQLAQDGQPGGGPCLQDRLSLVHGLVADGIQLARE